MINQNQQNFMRAHQDCLTPQDEVEFGVGDNVNVERKEGDVFTHNFTGHVKQVKHFVCFGTLYVVEDQDGDCWDCDPDQLSHSSDDIMHND